MTRRLLCLALLMSIAVSAAAVAPKRLGNASSLRKALANGAPVSVVLEYSRCQLVTSGDSRFSPPFAGGFLVDAWLERVGGERGHETVTVILTDDELVSHPGRGLVRRQVEVTVSLEDSVEITLRHVDLRTHDVLSTWRLSTTFDRGNTGAASFYRLD